MSGLPVVLALVLLTIPSPRAGYRVQDFADLLPPATEQELENLSREVDRQTTAELVIATVPSLEGMPIEEYANQLFNTMKIGKRDYNNGVLLLVAPNERRVRIEVGYGLEPLLPDGRCGEIRDRFIVPTFKQSGLAAGTVAGARELALILTSNPITARGIAGSAPAVGPPGAGSSGLSAELDGRRGWWSTPVQWLAVMAALILVMNRILRRFQRYPTPFFIIALLALSVPLIMVVAPRFEPGARWSSNLGELVVAAGLGLTAVGSSARSFIRYGPHTCRKCGARLRLLDEMSDDDKLAASQRLEEKLGSIDYDVWVCPTCLKENLVAHIDYLAGLGTCPRCRNRTLRVREDFTVSATNFTKTNWWVEECEYCTFRLRSPRLPPWFLRGETWTDNLSDSSGGGSSGSSGGGGGGGCGGGSSGGGGASGGW